MKIVREIIDWLSAVITAWYGWVGASATAGIVSFGQNLGMWGAPPRRIYVGLLVMGFLVSVYQAWQRERRKVQELETQMRSLTTPNIAIRVESIGIANSPEGEPFVTLHLYARNDGSDSNLDFRSARVTLHNRTIEMKYVIPPAKNIRLLGSPGNPDTILSIGDNFLNKYVSSAIRKGVPARGWACFVVPGVKRDEFDQEGATFYVSFLDIQGKDVEGSNEDMHASNLDKFYFAPPQQ